MHMHHVSKQFRVYEEARLLHGNDPDQNRLIKTHLYVDVHNANKRILVGLSTSAVFIPSGAKCRNRLTVGCMMSHLL